MNNKIFQNLARNAAYIGKGFQNITRNAAYAGKKLQGIRNEKLSLIVFSFFFIIVAALAFSYDSSVKKKD